MITIYVPLSGHLLAQKAQRRRFEIGKRRVALVVRDVLVHQAPEPLDRIQMRAVGGDEVELDVAPRPRQPSLHQLGVVVAGVVPKQMDQPLARIHRYIVSIAISNMMVLTAFTVAASIMRVLLVSRSIAPWMFRR